MYTINMLSIFEKISTKSKTNNAHMNIFTKQIHHASNIFFNRKVSVALSQNQFYKPIKQKFLLKVKIFSGMAQFVKSQR